MSSSYFGREQRIRDLMNIIQDERYTRDDLTSILETCLRHIVPHNHNNYTINIHNRYQDYPQSPMDEIDELDTLHESESTEAIPQSNTTSNNNHDLTTTVQNFVSSIINEATGAPSDSVTVHVNGRRENLTSGSTPIGSSIIPVSLDMMITDTGRSVNNISNRINNLTNLMGDGDSPSVNTNIDSAYLSENNTDTNDSSSDTNDSTPTGASHDSENIDNSENRETSYPSSTT
jgi:hypothetical protein